MKQIRELLVDLYECEVNLDDVQLLTSILKEAAAAMGSTVVKTVTHRFSPTGITIILILAETHISLHTWPEHKYAALDVFICSESIDPQLAWQTVSAALRPKSFNINNLERRIQ